MAKYKIQLKDKYGNLLFPTVLSDSHYVTDEQLSDALVSVYGAIDDLSDSLITVKGRVSALESTMSAKLTREIVQELPSQNISTTTIYMVLKDEGEQGNIYTEYLYINNKWEIIGDTKTSIEGLITESDAKELVDTAISDALVPYAKLNSPVFTGVPTVPDVSSNTSSNAITNKKYVDGIIDGGLSVEVWNLTSSAWEAYSGASSDYKIRYWFTSAGSGASKTEVPLVPGPQGTPGSAGVTPVISGGTATTLQPGASATVSVTSSGSAYTFDFGIPRGYNGTTPVISGGVTTTLPAGSSATVEVVSSGSNTYVLNFGIPAGLNGSNGSDGSNGSNGSDGISPVATVTQITSGAIITITDKDGTTSATVLNGTNGSNGSDGSNGSNGSDGISPIVSVTQTSSGAIIYTSDYMGTATVELTNGTNGINGSDGTNGSDGRLTSAYQVVSSLISGAVVVTHQAVPVSLKTSAGNLYPLQKGTISISSGAWYIDPTAYLVYDGVSAFSGPWTVYFAGGLPEVQTIISGGSIIVPQEHQAFKHTVVSSETISIDSSSLSSNTCMTFQMWLDMPSPAVSFTLPAFTWVGGTPDFDQASTRFVITVRWDGMKFLACSAYQEALA